MLRSPVLISGHWHHRHREQFRLCVRITNAHHNIKSRDSHITHGGWREKNEKQNLQFGGLSSSAVLCYHKKINYIYMIFSIYFFLLPSSFFRYTYLSMYNIMIIIYDLRHAIRLQNVKWCLPKRTDGLITDIGATQKATYTPNILKKNAQVYLYGRIDYYRLCLTQWQKKTNCLEFSLQ